MTGPPPAVTLVARATADEALHRWVDLFVDFLDTKHGSPAALQEGPEGNALHQYFVERLVPVGDELLNAASAGRGSPAISAFALMRGIGNLCIGGAQPRYNLRRLAALLVDGALATAEHTNAPGQPGIALNDYVKDASVELGRSVAQ